MENKNEEQVSKNSKELLDDIVKKEKDKKADQEKTDKAKDKKKKDKHKLNTKKLKHGTMATVLTCVFIALLVLVNIVTTMIFERYPITIDLTKDKIYSMTEKSEKYVKDVDVDVMVTIFADEETYTNYSMYNKQAVELLKNYCKLNHHISYRFTDIDSNPEIVKSYSDSVSPFDIIFETKTKVDGEEVQRTRKLTMIDLLSFDEEFVENYSSSYGMSIEMLRDQAGGDLQFLAYFGDYVKSSNAEQAFTSALMTVTDPDPVYVSLLTGRDELAELSYFRTLLIANGYNVSTTDITKDDIPENTDVIIVGAPQTDYLPEEVTKISDFLNNGGDLGKQLIYIASYGQSETPNLDEFLEEYGLAIGDGVICETYKDNYYNYPYYTVTTELSDSFDQDVQSKEPKFSSAFTRPVKTLFSEQGMVSTEEYVKSSENAYTADGKIDGMGIFQLGDKIEQGQQCYFAVGSKAKFANDGTGDTFYSNVLCFGSEYMLSSNYLAADQFDNSEYIFSVLGGITHKSDGIFIQPKTITGSSFEINQEQKDRLKWTFSLIIPAAVLIIGMVVWFRRKNK